MTGESSGRESLTKLLRQYRKVVEESRLPCVALHDPSGENLWGTLFDLYGDLLAPVLKTGNDLQDLIAVLSDYKASFDVTNKMLPGAVLEQFVAAKSDPEKLFAEAGLSASRLKKRLSEHPRTLLRFLSLADSSVLKAVCANSAAVDSLISSKRDAQSFVGLLAVLVNNNQVDAANLIAALPQVAALTKKEVAADTFNLVRALISENNPLLDSAFWLPRLADVCECIGSDDYIRIGRLMHCGSLVRIIKDTIGCESVLLEFWNHVKERVAAGPQLFMQIETVFFRACFPEMTRDDFTLLCREMTRSIELNLSLEAMQLPFKTPPVVIIGDNEAIPAANKPQSEIIQVRQLPAFPEISKSARFRHVEVVWQNTRVAFEFSDLASILENYRFPETGKLSNELVEAVFEAAKLLCGSAPEIVARVLTSETLGISRLELVKCLSAIENASRRHDGPPPYPEHDVYM